MNKFISVMLILCLAVVVAACGRTEDTDFSDSSDALYSDAIPEEPNETPEEESYDHLADPEVINADFEVTTNPDGSFSIETNLPGETELMLTLKGRGYLAQSKATVSDGVATSECFTDNGNKLMGDYTLEVLMPIPNVQNEYVRHFIGENGQYLQGPYVKESMGSVVVKKDFNVSFPFETETTSDTATNTSSDDTYNYQSTSNQTADGNYYRTPTGKRYHLDPDCGGKNSYLTTNISDLTPCEKCAQ